MAARYMLDRVMNTRDYHIGRAWERDTALEILFVESGKILIFKLKFLKIYIFLIIIFRCFYSVY